MASELSDERLREIYARAVEARHDPARADCPTPDALLALVRREGGESTRLALLDHAMACPDCRRDFELLRAIEAGRRADADAGVRHIRWRRPIGVALVTALAAALAFFAVLGPWQRRSARSDVYRGGATEAVAVAPLDGATIAAGSPTFVWHAVRGARGYVLEVVTPGGALVAARETTDTSAAPVTLPAGDYRWWVRARLDGGERRSVSRRLRVTR